MSFRSYGVTYCSAVDCTHNSQSEKLHRFPRNKELRRKWLIATNRQDWNVNELCKKNRLSYFLCMCHFKKTDFEVNPVQEILGNTVMRMKPNVIPSIFKTHRSYAYNIKDNNKIDDSDPDHQHHHRRRVITRQDPLQTSTTSQNLTEEVNEGGDKEATAESKGEEEKERGGDESSSEVDPKESETMEVDEEEPPSDNEEKKQSGDGPVIEISSVYGGVEVEDITSSESKESTTNDSTIRISTVTSLRGSNNQDDDEMLEDSPSSSSKTENEKKRGGMKLVSFAGLDWNEIAKPIPLSSSAVKSSSCSQCSKEIGAVFNAIVWQTMQFCDEKCLGEYQKRFKKCALCKKSVRTRSMGRYCVRLGSDIKQFCTCICLENYKKSLKVCSYCRKDISGDQEGFLAPIGDTGQFKDFCQQNCLKRYEEIHLGKGKAKETSTCAVCLREKTVEVELVLGGDNDEEDDDNDGNGETVKFCGHSCFSAYQSKNKIECSQCHLCENLYDVKTTKAAIYYDGCTKHFCSTTCQNVYVMNLIMKHKKIVTCHWCNVKKFNFDMIEKWRTGSELGSSWYCSIKCTTQAAASNSAVASARTANWNGKRGSAASAKSKALTTQSINEPVSSLAELPDLPDPSASEVPFSIQTQTVKETIKETVIKCPEDVEVRNIGTLTKPYMRTKGITCFRPPSCHMSCQTEEEGPTAPVVVPVVVPMWMPLPMHMYERPYPVPVPIPIPVPVPIFIPTTKNSSKKILNQIKKIQSGEETEEKAEPDLDDKVMENVDVMNDESKPLQQDQQQQQVEDLENEISPGEVVPKPLPVPQIDPSEEAPDYVEKSYSGRRRPFRKRRASTEADEEDLGSQSQERNPRRRSRQSRRSRPKKQPKDNSTSRKGSVTNQPPPPERSDDDSKLHLKFTIGLKAWKQWVVQKNTELKKERAQGKYLRSFETDLIKIKADELNSALCMFVKEAKTPNGDSYAPESLLYLVFGIQEYLFENGRTDNIFTDPCYEPFTTALHEVIKSPVIKKELGCFDIRIEEEHLWESKQLGAHSPQVLLNTLIYFNTKYFMIKTCENHMKLSFSHVMKHSKKTMTNQHRTALLRYCPLPTVKGQRQEFYEQHENIENPLRCPVKLYEFYRSKCPETKKSKNSNMFYLQPERYSLPSSPVWYSNTALNQFQLDKMLQRLLMVREVQEHIQDVAS